MRHSEHWRACFWLLTATLLWGLSFPLIKVLWLAQGTLVPGASSLFLAALAASMRFGIAAAIIAAFASSSLRKPSRSEWTQGIGLALFGGCGILLQMDGLAHTAASTSAFLTQFYCLLIPIWTAWRKRIIPGVTVVVSSAMVLGGVAILAGVQWSQIRIGRGELETLAAATFFAGQILWLERPCYAGNRVMSFTVIMFAGTAVLLFPIALLAAPSLSALPRAYSDGSVWFVMGAIIAFCTLGAYLMMNRWQRFVSATEAGLIYCIEPVAASAFALFLPGWLSQITGATYSNEVVTWRLGLGGALITAANLLIQVDAIFRTPPAPPAQSG